ncbi:ribonuclease P protein subunit p40 isoform X2 [Tribolium castaneum]|uniref:ribonuclease P protein subunit p40 isoform X2 n=1 Tax=Tribolium castaneum TaxID=7070 RepID=UPI00077DE50D|nr:PREDICTED: ribonuclease P protein subunit p40-like isoform X2 [Tribolium castaneum]|eukprot:XP_015835823.1 PREDICTED: ribonuclease P protein subunit p40-like isoform X2 [Tribolium castaneum]
MLCPEVFNFKAPESHFSSQKRNPNERNHLNTVNSLIYNHLVSVILPDASKVPESLTQALSNDCDYYKLKNVKISDFVARDFIVNFINSGNLYVLSVNTRIDCDNCVAITPEGQLILSLSKSEYQSLGLEGQVSHFHHRTQERYIVTIDLKQKCFKPGKPNYERTKASLDNLRFDVIVTWEPPSKGICPSSIARYFHDLGYETKLCGIQNTSHVVSSTQVPTVTRENHYEVVEWLGMIALQANLTDGAPDGYVTTYETPEPREGIAPVSCLQWRGFFTANQIARLYDRLSEFKADKGCLWAALYVQGFSDSPIAWRGEEHHFYTNGDNSYTLILTRADVITCVQKCSRKRYNNKRKGKPL